MILKSKRIYTSNGIVNGYLLIKAGRIVSISKECPADECVIDYENNRIIPGLFETHCHGSMGYSVHTKDDIELESELKGFLKGTASYGVSNIFVLTRPEWMRDIVELIKKKEIKGSKVLGIFSEGPYLNRVGEKGFDKGHPDPDIKFIEKMIDDCQGLLKLVALSPEITGIDVIIEYLLQQGIQVSFAHSNCNYKETIAAFDKGIRISTHTANVMQGIHHRDIGALGACLMDDRIMCEVICDGLRVCPEMLDLMFKVKGYDHFMMITDGGCTIGGPCGKYINGPFGDFEVTVEGLCITTYGRLGGSSKTLLKCVGELVERHHIPLEIVLKMSSYNQCKTYGFLKNKGEIKVDKDADLAIIDDDYNALATYSEGRLIYDCHVDKDIFNQEYLDKYKIA